MKDAEGEFIPPNERISVDAMGSVMVRATANRIKELTHGIEGGETLVERAKDVTAALDHFLKNGREEWAAFEEWIKAALVSARQSRMALDLETRALMADLREVRTFFLDDQHAAQVARLKEFVEVCERLQALKQSGFLDRVADTMLALAETKP